MSVSPAQRSPHQPTLPLCNGHKRPQWLHPIRHARRQLLDVCKCLRTASVRSSPQDCLIDLHMGLAASHMTLAAADAALDWRPHLHLSSSALTASAPQHMLALPTQQTGQSRDATWTSACPGSLPLGLGSCRSCPGQPTTPAPVLFSLGGFSQAHDHMLPLPTQSVAGVLHGPAPVLHSAGSLPLGLGSGSRRPGGSCLVPALLLGLRLPVSLGLALALCSLAALSLPLTAGRCRFWYWAACSWALDW